MPNTRSALKRMRADRKRKLRNLGVESELKTLTKRFVNLLQKNQATEGKEIFAALLKRIDQARSRGILHPNAANRKKSRLSRLLAKPSS